MTTLIEDMDNIQKKFNLRKWALEGLKLLESKYGMTTDDFVSKWRSNTIPEPEDHELLEEFLEWEGLYDTLQNVERELMEIENNIKKN